MSVFLQVLVDALALGSVYAIFTFGLTLVFGVLDLLNLAYGAIFAMGAYLACVLSAHADIPLILLTLIIMAVMGLGSALLDLVVFRTIRHSSTNKATVELSMLVASIGVATLLEAVIQNVTGGVTQSINPDVFQTEPYHLGEIVVTNLQIILVVLTIVIGAALMAVTKWSRPGRAMRAVAADPKTSALLGIDPERVSLYTMMVGGALAGLSGVLLGVYQFSVYSTMGDGLLLKAFAVIVIGGVGRIGGSLVASFGLALAETLVVVYGPAAYSDAVSFALIVLVLLIRPTGLFVTNRGLRS